MAAQCAAGCNSICTAAPGDGGLGPECTKLQSCCAGASFDPGKKPSCDSAVASRSEGVCSGLFTNLEATLDCP
jgi:hypothetical protein